MGLSQVELVHAAREYILKPVAATQLDLPPRHFCTLFFPPFSLYNIFFSLQFYEKTWQELLRKLVFFHGYSIKSA